MAERKVCVVITARPSYARIKTALQAIQQRRDLELQIVVAASALLDRYGRAADVIEEDGFEITESVFMVLEGENLVTTAKSAGLGIVELATVFDNLGPDVVVTIADRYETMATAVAASYMNIPLTHVQGGEVSGSIDEKVRHSVTKLADLHLVCHEIAAKRVISMGENPEAVFVTGCPSIDIAAEVAREPGLDFDPFTRYPGVGPIFEDLSEYVVVMQHAVSTEYSLAYEQASETLYAVRDLGIPALWFWPNVDAGSDATSKAIRVFRETQFAPNIHFFKNMHPEDFLRLAHNSRCVIGNSSVGLRECSYLGVPAVNIGSRQWGRERGRNVVDVTYDRDEILAAVQHQVSVGRYESDPVYGDGHAGKRIAELLATAPLSIEKHLPY